MTTGMQCKTQEQAKGDCPRRLLQGTSCHHNHRMGGQRVGSQYPWFPFCPVAPHHFLRPVSDTRCLRGIDTSTTGLLPTLGDVSVGLVCCLKVYFRLCCYCLVVVSDSFATPGTVTHQAPPSMGFPRQEYWSGFAISFSGRCSPPRDQTCISCIGRWILYH